nr:hypothetical protein [Candidatus Njordarchaeota archaeon]
MLRRIRDALRSKDQSAKLADMALKDEVAGLDLISSLGSTDEGVREVASKAMVEVSKRDYDKLLKLVSRWSGDRHYKIAAFLKWTEGLESKNLDRLRSVMIERMRSATAVVQLVNEHDEVNQKLSKLKEYYAQKRVSEPVFESLRAEYESKSGAATKKLLSQFLGNASSLEGLMHQRSKIRNELSILETRISLGDIGRKESEARRADLNRQLEDIQEKDRRLSEELSVMLMSSGPVNIYDESGEIVGIASDFSIDREKPAVELKVRLLSADDIQASRLSQNRNELIAFVYNLTNKLVRERGLTSDKLTPEVIESVASTVAFELKISSEEALQVEKLRFFIELTSWRSGKSRSIIIAAKGLTPTERGFVVKPGIIEITKKEPAKVEKPVELAPSLVEGPAKPTEFPPKPAHTPPKRVEAPPTSPEMLPAPPEPLPKLVEVEAKPITVAREPGTAPQAVPEVRSVPPEKVETEEKVMQQQFDSIDQELASEIKSLQQVLDEEEAKKKGENVKSISAVDDKVLSEIDRAAQKLRERMKK